MKKNKRKARVLALQVMYAHDLRKGDDLQSIFETIAAGKKKNDGIVNYAETLVRKAGENFIEIDLLLQKHTANWDIKRMAAIDRNILRLAVTELFYMENIPFKVVIDEAVEIAKTYGTDDSGKFVNGVIDAIYRNKCKK